MIKYPEKLNNRFNYSTELVSRANCSILKYEDTSLGNVAVAVKIFNQVEVKEEEDRQQFESEIGVLKSSSHQGLVPIIDYGFENNYPFIVMSLVEGDTLRDILKTQGVLSVDLSLQIIGEICDAVAEIHKKGGVHGHLDPRAVILKGGIKNLSIRDRIRVCGYYSTVIDKLVAQTTSVGKFSIDPYYISPEQLEGSKLDARSDIYSIACLLFEMITGKKVFEGGNPLVVASLRINQDPQAPSKLNPAVPAILDAAIIKALSKNKDDRFASIEDFKDAIVGGKKPYVNPFATQVAPLSVPNNLLDGNADINQTVAVTLNQDQLKSILSKAETETSNQVASQVDDQPKVEPVLAKQVEKEFEQTGAYSVGDIFQSGSLFFLEGSKKGEGFKLESMQTIIGSDDRCDLVIKGKKIPARCIIIVKRGPEYSIASISSTLKVKLNGNLLDLEKEYDLSKGDIIQIENHQIRYLAPGEVFSLDNVEVERANNKSGNKTAKIIMYSTLILLIIGGGVLLQYQSAVESKKKKQVEIAKKELQVKKEEIAKLIQRGDELFKEGKLIEPLEENAKTIFIKVLSLEPEQSYAKQRIEDINQKVIAISEQKKRLEDLKIKIDDLFVQADKYYLEQQLVSPPGRNAKDIYSQVLILDPENNRARARIKEIDNILSNTVEQVKLNLEKAKELAQIGNYINPPGDNALELLNNVFKYDPRNIKAREILIDMAAMNIYLGDKAKSTLNQQEMKKRYNVALSIGADSKFIENRLRGTELIGNTSSSIIIVSKGSSDDKKEKEVAQDQLKATAISEEELNKRLSQIYSERGDVMGKNKFIEIKKR